jgi:hypothetical protein
MDSIDFEAQKYDLQERGFSNYILRNNIARETLKAALEDFKKQKIDRDFNKKSIAEKTTILRGMVAGIEFICRAVGLTTKQSEDLVDYSKRAIFDMVKYPDNWSSY